MSDLSGKFGSFEDQIASNHTEIMDALNTIAFALGAPPTTPSTNLGDVVAAITITNGLLTDIFNTVDSINNNASLNAQRLLTLMLQTACPCDATVPMLPPPLLPTVTELEAEAKCQRIQFFLDMYASWVISVVVYLNDNGTISSFQVDNALALTFGSIPLDDGDIRPIPTGIRDSLTTLLNTSGSPSAINASIFDELTTGTVIADMRQALYAEDNALDGSPAAKAAALASGGPFASILAAAFYTNWANAIYGDLPVVDASGYDGSICAPPDEIVCATCNAPTFDVNWKCTWNGTAIESLLASGNDITLRRDLAEYAVTVISSSSNVEIVSFSDTGDPDISVQVAPCTVMKVTGSNHVVYAQSANSFSIQICANPNP